MTSHASYSSASSRRSHRMSQQHAQPIVWSLPTNVQGPPSTLYATYFQHPDFKYRSHHYPYSPSGRPPIYPVAMPQHYPHPPRHRRQSMGDGPRVSPQHIYPPPPPHHTRSRSYSHVQPYLPPPTHPTKSILKNGGERVSPPPQTPYVIPRSVRGRGLSFSSMKSFLGKRPPGPPAPQSASRRVRFDLPAPADNESWRRR